ncbi:MAG: DUF87 domain-containing protein [Candidatus Vogelbacteria bacterium]|nr:DUF87 domain-containing protein [Candidatus Vogelbacteria bacterium]
MKKSGHNKDRRENRRDENDKKPQNRHGGLSSIIENLEDETKHGVLVIIFLLITVFLSASALGVAGVAGEISYNLLNRSFGSGFFLFPLVSAMVSISFLRSLRPNIISSTFIGGGLFLLSSLGMVDILFRSATNGIVSGGIIGNLVAKPFVSLFDNTISIIFLGAVDIIAVLVMFNTHLSLENSLFGKKIFGEKEEKEDDESIESRAELSVGETKAISLAESKDIKASAGIQKDADKPAQNTEKNKKQSALGRTVSERFEDFLGSGASETPYPLADFTPPPLSILERDIGKPIVGDIKANANIIKRTLLNFGIDVEMDEISIGPSITRYALKPAEGIKLSRIVALQNDLSLALAAHPIRIEAPIPGKSLVGIEIPNSSKSTVGLGTLLASKKFQESSAPLLIPLGKGVSGIPYFADISKAPHMLIAGATGSGKSVTIHTIITSLLYRNSPLNLRFIMIDPKRVELTLYNGIPHLLTPVITDSKKTILILKWAAKEMERRYNILESHAVRDIDSYHKNIYEPSISIKNARGSEPRERMPFIVIVIDELADIMMAYPRELEAGIVRLAQMSRAVGIHLVISTQRPSVEIITGLIKANIPTRIALQVPSQIDSRTILDMPGAEKLLGAGDMLYLSGETSKPNRIQSGYISENEVKKLVKFLTERHRDDLPDQIDISNTKDIDNLASAFDAADGDIESAGDDEMYEEAREVVISFGKASASLLQRKLKLGYARAARMIDMLEERGVIGPGDGAKAREVYATAPDNNYSYGPEVQKNEGNNLEDGKGTDLI